MIAPLRTGQDTWEYRGFQITYWRKPDPDRRFDYDYVHDEYDGPGDERCGSAASVTACMLAIDELYEEGEV